MAPAIQGSKGKHSQRCNNKAGQQRGIDNRGKKNIAGDNIQ